eukprot:6327719-Amphidinium_carterae.1
MMSVNFQVLPRANTWTLISGDLKFSVSCACSLEGVVQPHDVWVIKISHHVDLAPNICLV